MYPVNFFCILSQIMQIYTFLFVRYIITCGHDGEVRVWAGIEDDDNYTLCVAEEKANAVVQQVIFLSKLSLSSLLYCFGMLKVYLPKLFRVAECLLALTTTWSKLTHSLSISEMESLLASQPQLQILLSVQVGNF